MQLYYLVTIILCIALFTSAVFVRKRIISREFENIKLKCYSVDTHEQFTSAYSNVRNFELKYRGNQKHLIELQEIMHTKKIDLEKKYRVIKKFSLPFGDYIITNHPVHPVGCTDWVYIEGIFGVPFEMFTSAYDKNKRNDIVIIKHTSGFIMAGTFKQLEAIIKQSTMKIVK